MSTDEKVHRFDNGIAVYKHHLIPVQQARYAQTNLHEPEEEAWFLKLLEKVRREPGAFCDVGAAIGYYVILARRVRPDLELIAFEPLEQHRNYLRDNLVLNGINPAEVTVRSEALADWEGETPFEQRDFSSVLAPVEPAPKAPAKARILTALGLRKPPAPVVPPGCRVVPTTTLDQVCLRMQGPIRLAKVDVQGFEMGVLRGATKAIGTGTIESWMVGTHSPELHRDCLSFLTQHGYEILHEDPKPAGQPDGIIAARRK